MSASAATDRARELTHIRADIAKVEAQIRGLAARETGARTTWEMMLARAEANQLREWWRALERRVAELEGEDD